MCFAVVAAIITSVAIAAVIIMATLILACICRHGKKKKHHHRLCSLQDDVRYYETTVLNLKLKLQVYDYCHYKNL